MRAAERGAGVVELLETVPDEYALGPAKTRGIIFDGGLAHEGAAGSGEGIGGIADIEADGTPAPFFRRLQEGAAEAADFEDFGVLAEEWTVERFFLAVAVQYSRIEVIHQVEIAGVFFVADGVVFFAVKHSALPAGEYPRGIAVGEAR